MDNRDKLRGEKYMKSITKKYISPRILLSTSLVNLVKILRWGGDGIHTSYKNRPQMMSYLKKRNNENIKTFNLNDLSCELYVACLNFIIDGKEDDHFLDQLCDYICTDIETIKLSEIKKIRTVDLFWNPFSSHFSNLKAKDFKIGLLYLFVLNVGLYICKYVNKFFIWTGVREPVHQSTHKGVSTFTHSMLDHRLNNYNYDQMSLKTEEEHICYVGMKRLMNCLSSVMPSCIIVECVAKKKILSDVVIKSQIENSLIKIGSEYLKRSFSPDRFEILPVVDFLDETTECVKKVKNYTEILKKRMSHVSPNCSQIIFDNFESLLDKHIPKSEKMPDQMFEISSWINGNNYLDYKVVYWLVQKMSIMDKELKKMRQINQFGNNTNVKKIIDLLWMLLNDHIEMILLVSNVKDKTDKNIFKIDDGRKFLKCYPWPGLSLKSHNFVNILEIVHTTMLKLNTNPHIIFSKKSFTLDTNLQMRNLNSFYKLLVRSMEDFSCLRGFDFILKDVVEICSKKIHLNNHLNDILWEGLSVLIKRSIFCLEIPIPFKILATIRIATQETTILKIVENDHKMVRMMIHAYILNKLCNSKKYRQKFMNFYKQTIHTIDNINPRLFFEDRLNSIWIKNRRTLLSKIAKLHGDRFERWMDNKLVIKGDRFTENYSSKRVGAELFQNEIEILRHKLTISDIKILHNSKKTAEIITSVIELASTIKPLLLTHISISENLSQFLIGVNKITEKINKKKIKEKWIRKELERIEFMTNKEIEKCKQSTGNIVNDQNLSNFLLLYICTEFARVKTTTIIKKRNPIPPEILFKVKKNVKKRHGVNINKFINTTLEMVTNETLNDMTALKTTICCGRNVSCTGSENYGMMNVSNRLDIDKTLEMLKNGEDVRQLKYFRCYNKSNRNKTRVNERKIHQPTTKKTINQFFKIVKNCGLFFDDSIKTVDLTRKIVVKREIQTEQFIKANIVVVYTLCFDCGCIFKRDYCNYLECSTQCDTCWLHSINNAIYVRCYIDKTTKFISPISVLKIVKIMRKRKMSMFPTRYLDNNDDFNISTITKITSVPKIFYVTLREFELVRSCFTISKYVVDTEGKTLKYVNIFKKMKKYKKKYDFDIRKNKVLILK